MAFELTEREIAIAAGEDPDAFDPVQDEQETDTEVGDGEGTPSQEGEIDKEVEGKDPPEPTAKEGETPGGTDASTGSWVNDDVLLYARSYGLDEKDLATFADADEFKRATAIIDRNLAKQHKDGDGERATTTTPPAATKPAETPAAKPNVEELDLDPEKFREAGFDDETIQIVTYARKMREELDALKPQIEKISQSAAEEQQRQYINSFHDVTDTLDESRYGRSLDDQGNPVQLKPEQRENRRKLYEAAATLAAGMESRQRAAGEEPRIPPMSVLLRRAENVAFADAIRKQERETITKQVAAQSRRRRPVAGSRPTKPVASGNQPEGDPVLEVANHPDVIRAWQKFQDANGE